jgi:hypothetical protein
MLAAHKVGRQSATSRSYRRERCSGSISSQPHNQGSANAWDLHRNVDVPQRGIRFSRPGKRVAHHAADAPWLFPSAGFPGRRPSPPPNISAGSGSIPKTSTPVEPISSVKPKTPPPACAPVSRLFLKKFLNDIQLQITLGKQSLQPAVLLLQLPQPLHLRLAHRSELFLPHI